MLKNRASGVFDPPLVGPFEFVKYKDDDRYAVLLRDDNGVIFDASVAHIVPHMDLDTVTKKRRRGG